MSLYAFLANILDQPHGNALQAHGRAHANLVAYCARMQALCYPGGSATDADPMPAPSAHPA